jgi:lipoate---protein ligase
MQTFRLLDTPPMTAAENMALDEALLELKGRGTTPNTIRFLQFSPRAVLVGFHQSVAEEVRRDYCGAHGIHVNRRITGGGAIYFDESQVGWEMICDKGFFDLRFVSPGMFRTLCDPVIAALSRMGLEAVFRPRNDIEIRGRKISGTGGTESEGAFLFQGTMLVDFDADTMLRALRIPVEKLKAKEIDSVRERVTCLRWELGRVPPLEEIKEAIRLGFEEKLRIRLEPGGLTGAEEALFRKKLEFFESEDWIDRVRPAFRRTETVQAACKAEAGMVRFTLVVDPARRRLKDIYITGDFLSFPPRALYDLQSLLRGVSLDLDRIRGLVRGFFDRERIRIPGMTCEEFLRPLDHAFAKIGAARFGIPLEHCNRISVTNGPFEEVLRRQPSVLLLPYCAKPAACAFRYEKGCSLCGGCSIGDAWALGLARDMEVVSITSFEDLKDEMARMKAAGVPAFIGCCCEPFFTKHAEDFHASGIPGILLEIDSTTCYELDKAREAYAGRFENETRLDLDLLEAVLSVRDEGIGM